jgi:hypothetical protein
MGAYQKSGRSITKYEILAIKKFIYYFIFLDYPFRDLRNRNVTGEECGLETR